MSKYIRTGKGIKVKTWWGEEGELCATYKHRHAGDDKQIRYFRIRLGPAHFTDLPLGSFEITEKVIKFSMISKLFDTHIY